MCQQYSLPEGHRHNRLVNQACSLQDNRVPCQLRRLGLQPLYLLRYLRLSPPGYRRCFQAPLHPVRRPRYRAGFPPQSPRLCHQVCHRQYQPGFQQVCLRQHRQFCPPKSRPRCQQVYHRPLPPGYRLVYLLQYRHLYPLQNPHKLLLRCLLHYPPFAQLRHRLNFLLLHRPCHQAFLQLFQPVYHQHLHLSNLLQFLPCYRHLHRLQFRPLYLLWPHSQVNQQSIQHIYRLRFLLTSLQMFPLMYLRTLLRPFLRIYLQMFLVYHQLLFQH